VDRYGQYICKHGGFVDFSVALSLKNPSPFPVCPSEDPLHPDKVNLWALRAGLPLDVCRNLVNPGFEDPFDVRKVRPRGRIITNEEDETQGTYHGMEHRL